MDSRTCVIVALVCLFSVGSLGSTQVQLLGEDSVSIEQHTAIRLVCRVPTTITQVTWKRDTVTINADPAKKVTIEFEQASDPSTHHSVLTIAEAEETDRGTYSCYANDNKSDKSISVTITDSEVSISAITRKVTLVPGSPLTLACQADVHTHVEWRKGSTVLNDDTQVAITEVADSTNTHIKTSKLTISRAMESDAGSYLCLNEHHSDDRDEIIVAPKSETSGQSSTSEVSALLLGSVIVLALLR